MGLSYATFSDPDGNSWLFQETATRLPGATDARTTTDESVKSGPSVVPCSSRTGSRLNTDRASRPRSDQNWYALFMTTEQEGPDLPT